jgi:hypothetical protein
VGIATQHGHPTLSRDLDQPPKQRRFPDPSLTLDDRTSRGPAPHQFEPTGQQLQLNTAADQPRQRPRRHAISISNEAADPWTRQPIAPCFQYREGISSLAMRDALCADSRSQV